MGSVSDDEEEDDNDDESKDSNSQDGSEDGDEDTTDDNDEGQTNLDKDEVRRIKREGNILHCCDDIIVVY